MAEHYRKLQVVGNRSYSISLPKKWILRNNISKNEEIQILEENNQLILSPKADSKKKNSGDITVENLQLIPSIILLAYTRGIFSLNLNFKSKEDYLSAKPLVLEILSYLEGYKITNETESKISITDSYNGINLPVKDTAKRMVIILNNMLDCIIGSKNKTKEILEREADSLYHLSNRVLYLCSIDSKVMRDNQVTDMEEIFLWRLIFKKLENIADVLEKIPRKAIKEDNISGLFEIITDVFVLNKKITIQKISDIKEKKYYNSDCNEIKDMAIDILNNYLLIELNKKLFAVK